MPRFYFDIVDPVGGRVADEGGLWFDNLEGAKKDALITLREMAADDLGNGEHFDIKIAIRARPAGELLCTVTLPAGEDG